MGGTGLPETGKMESVGAISFGACVVEVEVDTDTGVVDIHKAIQVWEVGKAVNPMMCKMQIHGGLSVGLGYTFMENAMPYYPGIDHSPGSLADYQIPTFADYPEDTTCALEEVPHPVGVNGANCFTRAVPPATGILRCSFVVASLDEFAALAPEYAMPIIHSLEIDAIFAKGKFLQLSSPAGLQLEISELT